MTTETALELTKRINELQKKAETQIAIDGIEASTLDSKRKFVEILLNNYFGNKEFFDLFGPVRRSQIGKNGRTFISGYVSNSEFQALCSFYGDSPNNEHPILRRTEDTQAKLYTTTDVLGAEILEIESENIVLRDNTFYEIGAEYLIPDVTSAMGKYPRSRFPKFVASLRHQVDEVLKTYKTHLQGVKQENTNIKQALGILQEGLKKIN